ncbi:hypothetical protein STTU_6203 [Streptomyces sp. Tu6071]|nr:hypothetical protein STTU_6203 [Streptomyces sp. Tu6071]
MPLSYVLPRESALPAARPRTGPDGGTLGPTASPPRSRTGPAPQADALEGVPERAASDGSATGRGRHHSGPGRGPPPRPGSESSVTQDPTEVQNLKAQYEAKVAADLHANTEEQSRIAEEIDALRERLGVLAREQGMLTGVQQALGGAPATTADTAPATTADTAPAPAAESAKVPRARAESPAQAPASAAVAPEAAPVPVPAPASGLATTVPASVAGTAEKAPARTTSKPAAKTKTAAKSASKAASKTAAKPASKAAPKTRAKSTAGAKAPAKSAPKPTAKPTAKAEAKSATSPATTTAPSSATDTTPAGRITLRELISRQLAAHGEPRSAAEVGSTLREEHPDRELKGNVVRTTLEALVAKGLVQRSRQQKSVYYTHTTAAGTTTRD